MFHGNIIHKWGNLERTLWVKNKDNGVFTQQHYRIGSDGSKVIYFNPSGKILMQNMQSQLLSASYGIRNDLDTVCPDTDVFATFGCAWVHILHMGSMCIGWFYKTPSQNM